MPQFLHFFLVWYLGLQKYFDVLAHYFLGRQFQYKRTAEIDKGFEYLHGFEFDNTMKNDMIGNNNRFNSYFGHPKHNQQNKQEKEENKQMTFSKYHNSRKIFSNNVFPSKNKASANQNPMNRTKHQPIDYHNFEDKRRVKRQTGN